MLVPQPRTLFRHPCHLTLFVTPFPFKKLVLLPWLMNLTGWPFFVFPEHFAFVLPTPVPQYGYPFTVLSAYSDCQTMRSKPHLDLSWSPSNPQQQGQAGAHSKCCLDGAWTEDASEGNAEISAWRPLMRGSEFNGKRALFGGVDYLHLSSATSPLQSCLLIWKWGHSDHSSLHLRIPSLWERSQKLVFSTYITLVFFSTLFSELFHHNLLSWSHHFSLPFAFFSLLSSPLPFSFDLWTFLSLFPLLQIVSSKSSSPWPLWANSPLHSLPPSVWSHPLLILAFLLSVIPGPVPLLLISLCVCTVLQTL